MAEKNQRTSIVSLLDSCAARSAENQAQVRSLNVQARKDLISSRDQITRARSSTEEVRRSLRAGTSVSLSNVVRELLLKAMASNDSVERQTIVDVVLDGKQRPLHIAAAEGNLEVVEMLLMVGASLEVKDKNKWSALHYAAEGHHFEVMQLLLERECSVLSETTDGLGAVHLVAMRPIALDQADFAVLVLDQLLELGQDVNAQNRFGETPLHLAAKSGCLVLAQYLLSKRALVNIHNKRKETPLHYAARKGHLCVLLLLLRAKANAALAGADGTARDVAYAERQHHVVAFFDAPDEKMRERDFFLYIAEEKPLGVLMLFRATEDKSTIKVQRIEPLNSGAPH